MKVLKFGGTSVGSAERIKALVDIVNPNEPQIVVLSAVSGTTNALVEISGLFAQDKKKDASKKIQALKKQYEGIIAELFSTPESLLNGQELIDYHFKLIQSFDSQSGVFGPLEEKIILAQGELLSTTLFHLYLTEKGIRSKWLPALDFMKIDDENEPVIEVVRAKLTDMLTAASDHHFFITQGYICRNSHGEIDNLRRGGSDYTASLIGAAIQAEEVQIWTDIDGIHNNDPRIVPNTRPIRQISFDEAAELAYFGAKILHPQCVFPARRFNVPVRILNTMDPGSQGTVVTQEGLVDKSQKLNSVTAIAGKDQITAIRIHSSRMLLAYGFLRKVFEVFERYKTPIDMITTSEVAISLTIDDATHLAAILDELKLYGQVEVDTDQTIICVVGQFDKDTHGYASRVLDAVKHLPIRMISYGGSNYNVSLLVRTEDKIEALRSLHNRIF